MLGSSGLAVEMVDEVSSPAMPFSGEPIDRRHLSRMTLGERSLTTDPDRILPALIAMIGAFLLFGLVALTPAELRELAKETVPALWGLSNLLFYTGGDYFAPAAERSPLLMTWSLGIEEQFYIVLPFILLLAARLRRYIKL